MAVAGSPTGGALDAILGATTRVTRRLEIYEADGVTLWDGVDPSESRLVDGSVGVDSSRAERRSIDCTLENSDGLIKHDPNGFWYDKVLKVYRGVTYDNPNTQPRVLIIQDPLGRMLALFRGQLGLRTVDLFSGTPTLADFADYDIIAADSNTSGLAYAPLMTQAYNLGYSIWTSGLANDETQLPFVVSSIAKASGVTWAIDPFTGDSPLAGGWSSHSFTGDTTAGRTATALANSASVVGTMTHSSTTTFVCIVAQNNATGRWFHYQPNLWGDSTTNTLFGKSIGYLYNYSPFIDYETQIGEFNIDRISDQWFPNQLKVTGRDATKKLLGSKFSNALTFAAGTDAATILAAVAANGGITKTLLNTVSQSLATDASFARADERWKAISDICQALNLEAFVNAFGYLVVRPFKDPVTSPVSLTLEAGQRGNLVDYSKSSDDTRIYNHIVVSSDSSDASAGLYFGEAKNEEPSSPTNIRDFGDRTYFYTSPFFTSNDQCKAYADSVLKTAALEEFELSFSSLVFPWLEAGDILNFVDPKEETDVPSRFLMTAFSIPLGLGPMTGTGKRVTIVGSASTPGG